MDRKASHHVEPLAEEALSTSLHARQPEHIEPISGRLLGSYLLALGACSEKDILRGLSRQEEVLARNRHLPLGRVLLEMQAIRTDQLETALKHQTVDLLLTGSSSFQHLDREALAEMYACSEHNLLAPQEIVFRQSEPAQSVYVVLKGSVGLTHRLEEGREIDVALVRPGEIFGEMGPFTRSAHFVTARSLERSAVLAVPGDAFFERYASEPWMSREMVRKWFRAAVSGRMQTRLFHDHHYRELLSQRETRPCIPLLGSSRRNRQLRESLIELAESARPVLLLGGPGTMKTRVAQFVHEHGPDRHGPFIIFHPGRIPDFIRSLLPEGFDPLDPEETVQLGALFGFDESILPAGQPPWHGFLQLAHNGTLVIDGVADLRSKAQRQLAAYISSGLFYPLGSESPGQASLRIVVAADDDLQLDNDLFLSLSRNEVVIPPLRRRKRDLREVVTRMAAHIGSEENKSIAGIDEEALNKIVAYDWPGNDRELEGVVQRGVTLAKTSRLSGEDVFIGEEPLTGKPAFNLLNLPMVRRFFESSLYPKALRLGMALMFLLVIAMGLWGSPEAESNVSLLLVWANWEPLLILSCILLARIWCSMCPIGLVVEWFRKIRLPRLSVPQEYHRFGYWMSALGLALIFWVQASWDVWHNPVATSLLLLGITGTAALFALSLEGNIWCRYACPLGMMVATLARTSVVEVRANVNYCGNECRSYECYTGRDGISGCQMAKGPFAMQTNQDCIVCGNCVKACPHRSVRVNLRPPGWELRNPGSGDLAMIVFVPLLWGTQLFRSQLEADWLQAFLKSAGSVHLGLGLFMAGMVLLAFLIGGAGMLVFRWAGLEGDKRLGSAFFLAGLPIVYAFEVALRLEPLLNRAADFFAVVGRQIGSDLPSLAFRLDLQSIAILQVAALALGTGGALLLAARLEQSVSGSQDRPAWSKHLPLLLLGGLSIGAL